MECSGGNVFIIPGLWAVVWVEVREVEAEVLVIKAGIEPHFALQHHVFCFCICRSGVTPSGKIFQFCHVHYSTINYCGACSLQARLHWLVRW